MSYMEITGWIREFDEQVEIFLAFHRVRGFVEFLLIPFALPFFLYLLVVIPLHGSSVSYEAKKRYNLSHVARFRDNGCSGGICHLTPPHDLASKPKTDHGHVCDFGGVR